jgi:hypothetical protein
MGSFTAISLIEEGAAILLASGLRTGFVVTVSFSTVLDFSNGRPASPPSVIALYYRDLKPVPEFDISFNLESLEQTLASILDCIRESKVYASGKVDAVVLTWDEAGVEDVFEKCIRLFRSNQPQFSVPMILADSDMVLQGCQLFPSVVSNWEDSFVQRSAFLPTVEMRVRDLQDAVRMAERDGDQALETTLKHKLRALTVNALKSSLWERTDGEMDKNYSSEN